MIPPDGTSEIIKHLNNFRGYQYNDIDMRRFVDLLPDAMKKIGGKGYNEGLEVLSGRNLSDSDATQMQ